MIPYDVDPESKDFVHCGYSKPMMAKRNLGVLSNTKPSLYTKNKSHISDRTFIDKYVTKLATISTFKHTISSG